MTDVPAYADARSTPRGEVAPAGFVVGAALLPACAALAAVWATRDAGRTGAWPLRGLTADVLFYTALAVVVAAPLSGTTLGARMRRRATGIGMAGMLEELLAPWAALLGGSIVVVAATVTSMSTDTIEFLATAHAALAAVALALTAFGALCGTAFADPLDAVACSMGVTLMAAAGVLTAGSVLDQTPRAVLEWWLAASPFVALVSAARIDLARMDLVYRISPLARLHVGYPTWWATCATYGVVALSCLSALAWTLRVPHDAGPSPRGL